MVEGSTDRRRLAIVSYQADHPFSPRGIRTREVVRALEPDWDIELVSGPPADGRGAPGARPPRWRRIVRGLHSSILIDRYELDSRRRFRSWSPPADFALLIGSTLSVLSEAGQRLRRLGIPYLVDVGDPLVLTARDPTARRLGLARGRRAEEALLAGAAGAIVTTRRQADRLSGYLEGRPILVRPNGFSGEPPPAVADRPPGDPLRLIHFGALYGARIDVWPFIARIAAEGPWQQVEFHQFGAFWERAAGALPDNVTVAHHEPVPWSAALREARGYHAAVAVGSRDPGQLPSKVVSYLTLPIPRLAFVESAAESAISDYVADKPGWLVVDPSVEGWVDRLADHVRRPWAAGALAPPAGESWEAVAAELAGFVGEIARSRLPEGRTARPVTP